ncbi:MAG: hypothetical protein P8X55_02355 [Desulfosarcinaceae bacterium]|jgi:hypothetical protein
MRTNLISLIFGLTLLSSAFSNGLRADTIILNSGEKFTSTRVWEENGAIRFNMNGLIVKVEKKDVASIIHDGAGERPAETARPARAPEPAADPTLPPDQARLQPDAKPAPPLSRPAAPRHETTAQKPPLTRPEGRKTTSAAVNGTGVQGIAWEMSPGQVPGLVHVQTEWDNEGLDHYIRPDEALRLGSARLDGIVYGFWEKRLYSIMYWVGGPKGYAKLKKAVFTYYGPGTKSERGLERYIWRSPDTDRMLEFDKKSNNGIFWMRSRELNARMKQS